ncbi:hypothetical protein E4U17_007197 [Claviceps sp. LM77 group G4]|nr:hypothetical protein E4U17_007197 [Claviceps sp. LM77 group G4]
MHAQMLQKACARAKPEVHKTGVALQNYFRHFSTSNRLTTDDDDDNNNNNNNNAADAPRPPTPPNSSATQRSRAATREISDFLKGRGRGPSENGPSSASSSPLTPNASSLSKPRVIDVRSLPRSLGSRGRTGTFRSRFGGQDGQQGQQQQQQQSSGNYPAGGSRFSRGPGGGRGGRGGGRGGSRGGRFDNNNKNKNKNKKRDVDGEAGDKKESDENTRRREANLEMDEEEVIFDRLMRFHSKTEYQPAFSLQSLVGHVPSFPSGEAGRTAIALEKLQEVGGEISTAKAEGGAPGGEGSVVVVVGGGAAAAAAAVENDAQKQDESSEAVAGDNSNSNSSSSNSNSSNSNSSNSSSSNSSSGGGGGAESKTPNLAVIQGVDDAVLEKIYEQAIQGKHEKMEFGTGPIAASRNLHLRTGTWNSGAMEKFEGKLKALIGGAGAVRGGKNSGNKVEAR